MRCCAPSPTRPFRAWSVPTIPTASGSGPAASWACTRRSPTRSARCPTSSARVSASCSRGWRQMGFLGASQRSREQLLRNLAALGPEARAGAQALVGLSLFFGYSIPDPQTGVNPFWAEFGYPGPPPPAAPQPSSRRAARPGGRRGRFTADAVVVGSGAGGARDRGRPGRGGPAGDRARGGRAVRRVRVQPVRAVGLPEPLLARRPEPDGRPQRRPLRGIGLRRRHDDQLDQLPAHEAVGARAVGARARAGGRSPAPSSTATSTRSGSGSRSTTAAPT